MPWPLSVSVKEGFDAFRVRDSCVAVASSAFCKSSDMAAESVESVTELRRREMTVGGRGRIGGASEGVLDIAWLCGVEGWMFRDLVERVKLAG
jgi:hypothetical protein